MHKSFNFPHSSLDLDHSKKFKVFDVYPDRNSYEPEGRIADWGYNLVPARLNCIRIGEVHWCHVTKKKYERLN